MFFFHYLDICISFYCSDEKASSDSKQMLMLDQKKSFRDAVRIRLLEGIDCGLIVGKGSNVGSDKV